MYSNWIFVDIFVCLQFKKLEIMRSLTFAIFLLLFTLGVNAQRAGDWSIGADAGYVSYYKDIVYGARTTYSVTEPLEFSASFLMNPALKSKDPAGDKSEGKWFSYNIDWTYYALMQRVWSMGPTIGGQYLDYNVKYKFDQDTFKAFAFNVGWRIRLDLSDNIKMTGGWRYSTGQDDTGYHLFYVGVGYCFNFY